MDAREHGPFRRGGEQLPVRYVVAPPEPVLPPAPEPKDRSGLYRGLTVAVSLVLVAALVLVGHSVLGAEPERRGPMLVAGLDEAPAASLQDAVDAYLVVDDVELTATFSRHGSEFATVRATQRGTGQVLWEQRVDRGGEVGEVRLVDTSADGSVIVALAAPWVVIHHGNADARFHVEMHGPLLQTLVSLDLTTGVERARAAWNSAHEPVASDDGRLFRWDREQSKLLAMQGLEEPLWETPLDVGDARTFGIREHGGWLLVVPDEDQRRGRYRGSDVFLTALDPATGERAPWMEEAPGERHQRMILGEMFVEFSVGAGERVVRARDWAGERLWQRFDDGALPVVTDGALYTTALVEQRTELTRLDPADGDELWTAPLEGTVSQLRGDWSELFVMLREEYVVKVLDAGDGSWTRSMSYAPEAGTVGVQLDDGALPFFGADKYFVATVHVETLTLVARSIADGETLWRRSYPGFQTVRQAGDKLVLGTPGTPGSFGTGRVAPL
ncbi:MAG: PQQ-binding-like beta-propeller repeat protein [Propionibacterium sp.]|nr:PQQ-binding-like beta-propeller repeat protein [Propionibacterium sp.]